MDKKEVLDRHPPVPSRPKRNIVPIQARPGHGRVYIKASINGKEAMALLDSAATISVASETMAGCCVHTSKVEPAATNHKLEFVDKVRVLVQVADRVIVPLTLYIARGFFRDLLFGIYFMTESCATLKFPSKTLTIDGKDIPTKLGKVRYGAYSICDIHATGTYMMSKLQDPPSQDDNDG